MDHVDAYVQGRIRFGGQGSMAGVAGRAVGEAVEDCAQARRTGMALIAVAGLGRKDGRPRSADLNGRRGSTVQGFPAEVSPCLRSDNISAGLGVIRDRECHQVRHWRLPDVWVKEPAENYRKWGDADRE